MGFKMTKQVLVKAPCNGEQLAKAVLNHLGAKMETGISGVLNEQHKAKLNVSQLFIMPSFHQFLGGRTIN